MNRDQTETLSGGPPEPDPGLPGAGSLVARRYELRTELGRGGYGVVFEAFDRELGQTVALKALRPDRATPAGDQRFRREVVLARSVHHPNLIRVFDFGIAHDFFFLTMELVRGESLAERLARVGRLPLEDAIALAGYLARALVALHEAGIVHRDVKPSNVLIPAGEPGGLACARLTDLGIARRLDSEETRRTLDAHLVGTLAYLAPEVVRGARATPASDLFSLGLTLVDALLGREREGRGEALASALAHLRSVPWAREIRRLRPETPRWYAEWLERLLQSDPHGRYASAAAALRDFDRQRSPRARARALRWWAGAALALALAAAAASGWRHAGARGGFAGLRPLPEGGLAAYAGDGRELWRLTGKDAPSPATVTLAHGALEGRDAVALVRWRRALPWNAEQAAALELLDPHSGAPLRRIRLLDAGALESFTEQAPVFVPWGVHALDLDGDGRDEILVVFNHLPSWPSATVLWEPALDRVRTVFAAAGHQRFLAAEDLDGDGRRELLFGGVASLLGRYRSLSAVRLDPWIGSGVVRGLGGEAISAELLRAKSPGNLVWQSLLVGAGFDAVHVDRERGEIEVLYPGGHRTRLGLDGLAPRAGAPARELRSERKWAALERLRQVLRLRQGAEWANMAEEAGRAAGEASEAAEPLLVEAALRLQAIAWIRGGRVGEGIARNEALQEASSETSQVRFETAQALHLAGRLEEAVSWYRRGRLGPTESRSGAPDFSFLLGEVYALCELGRFAEAEASVESYRRFMGRGDASYFSDLPLAYARFRRGDRGVALPAVGEPQLGSAEDYRYLALELEAARGAPVAGLLSRLDAELTVATAARAVLHALRADVLRRLGRTAEARAAAQAAASYFRPDLNTLDFALRDLVAARIAAER